MPPALKRAAEQGLVNLESTGSFDPPTGFMEAEAAIVPGQTAIINQPASLTFQVVDHILIYNLKHRAGRKNGTPMSHQFDVSAIVAAQLRQIVAEIQTVRE